MLPLLLLLLLLRLLLLLATQFQQSAAENGVCLLRFCVKKRTDNLKLCEIAPFKHPRVQIIMPVSSL